MIDLIIPTRGELARMSQKVANRVKVMRLRACDTVTRGSNSWQDIMDNRLFGKKRG